MGQTREELANTVKQRLNNTTVTFTAEGNSVKASLKDLGVTVDTDKTVDALLTRRPATWPSSIFSISRISL